MSNRRMSDEKLPPEGLSLARGLRAAARKSVPGWFGWKTGGFTDIMTMI